MALTPSTMLPLGSPAPDFRLPDTDGRFVERDEFRHVRRVTRRLHLQPLPLRQARSAGPRGLGRRVSNAGSRDRRHQFKRRRKLSRRSSGVDGARESGSRLHFSRICTTNPRRSRTPIKPPVRPISMSSTGTGCWFIAARWTQAGRATTCR